ncbi:DUF72 domain-containing protein [Cuniculiplasma sp. SKW4]|uniref:DUF72 domain-containing protein n=1 Tax=Cuniculiplasma sp. SKW4 TaxID=3400171 RepID=UPI003FD0C5AC
MIGCSGWAYSDWKAKFYGKSKPSLQYYSHFFNAVEVDSTYYRIPSRDVVKKWVEKFSPGINFSVKLPGDISHGKAQISVKKQLWDVFNENVMKPISKAQDSVMILMTIPPGTVDIEGYLNDISEITPSYAHLCIEPRVKDRIQNDHITGIIEDNGFIPVSADNYFINLNRIGGNSGVSYVRMHGRNPEFLKAVGMEKFNYFYSSEELEDVAQRIKDAEGKFKDIYVFFNNHPNGNAPLNAISLSRILGIEKKFL